MYFPKLENEIPIEQPTDNRNTRSQPSPADSSQNGSFSFLFFFSKFFKLIHKKENSSHSFPEGNEENRNRNSRKREYIKIGNQSFHTYFGGKLFILVSTQKIVGERYPPKLKLAKRKELLQKLGTEKSVRWRQKNPKHTKNPSKTPKETPSPSQNKVQNDANDQCSSMFTNPTPFVEVCFENLFWKSFFFENIVKTFFTKKAFREKR